MNRTRTLLALALATLLGLALAQGMMGTPNDPRAPGNGYGNFGGYGMMQSGYGGYGPGGLSAGMGGYGMGPWGATPNTPQERYDETEARELAVTFLADYLPGAALGDAHD